MQIRQLEAGQWYANVHTKKFPTGEIGARCSPLGSEGLVRNFWGRRAGPPSAF
jgi:hypothetical protein